MYVCETEIECVCASAHMFTFVSNVCVLCVILMHMGKEEMVGKQAGKLADEVQRAQFDSSSLHFHREISSRKLTHPHPPPPSPLILFLMDVPHLQKERKNTDSPQEKNVSP